MTRSHFTDQNDVESHTTFWGPALTVGAGARFESRGEHRLGVAFGYDLLWSWGLKNEIGDHHIGGGQNVSIRLIYRQ